LDQFPRVLPEIVDFVVNIWVWVATYIQRGFAEWECKKSYFCLAIEMISGYNLIRLFQAFYIQTGGVKMQLHLSGFVQIHYNTESVSISASTNWFIQGKSQKMILYIHKCESQSLHM